MNTGAVSVRRRASRDGIPSGEGETPSLDPEHLASIERGLEQSRKGRYSTAAEVEAAFALFDV